MKLNQAYVLAAVSLLPFSALWLHAADSDANASAQAAQTESVKREQLIFSANQAITDGQRFLASGNYDDAATRFQYAVDALTDNGASAARYRVAAEGLASAKAGQAQALAKNAKFAQAATLLQAAINLQPLNPEYPLALENLKRQQIAYEAQSRDPEGTVNNPAVTDEFKDKVAAVQKLLFQGDAYFRTGQYDKAEDTYSKVLILDPYNKAARTKMDHVELYKTRAEGFRHEEYEQARRTDLDLKWSEAISTDIVVPPKSGSGSITQTSNRAAITRKLQSIIIDKVNFDRLDIAAVVQYLYQKSKELDPEHEGVNFVLRLTSETVPATDTGTTPGATPAPAGTPPAAGTTPAGTGTPSTNTQSQAIRREVSITLENVPLDSVLRYIVDQTGLQYTIEDYAVYLRPSIDEGETLTPRTFLVPPNFFQGSALHVTVGTTPDTPTIVEAVSTDVQKELENRGIRFPAGATATFLPGSSKLVVRNTPEQLDLIANLIDQLSKETPQVEIEAKLAEFTEDAIKGLSFNYTAGTTPLGTTPAFGLSTSLRTPLYTTDSPTGGLQPNGIDTLILQNDSNNSGLSGATFPGTSTPIAPNTPTTLTLGGVLDGLGMAAVINAINNMKGVSLLSAPSVTTQNNLKASIDIVREFPYPTSFEKPKLSGGNVAYTSGPGAGAGLTLGIPPTPREFTTADIGVSLEVKPTTYPDQRIDLDITKAQVLDFDGFIDYGSDIVSLASATNIHEADTITGPTVLTPGIINQPVFNKRSILTRLQVLDGQTAVLGGLIREDTQEINDKVPVLGDLPLVGRLFQSKVTQRTKKTLLLFVTARLVRSNGKPQYIKTLEAEPEEEKLPEPPPIGSGITLPPLQEGGS